MGSITDKRSTQQFSNIIAGYTQDWKGERKTVGRNGVDQCRRQQLRIELSCQYVGYCKPRGRSVELISGETVSWCL